MQQRLRSKFFLTFVLALTLSIFYSAGQNYSIILGRPTDVSVTANILFDRNVDYYFQYGIQSGNYTDSTGILYNVQDVPDEIDLQNLLADVKYYYVVKYKLTNSSVYSSSPEYSFHTQRAIGSSFTFTVESDEHLYDKKGVQSIYQLCLNNQAQDEPDFMLSLGDIFGDDHHPDSSSSPEFDSLHKAYRPFLGSLCHSVPFYVCLGNHEGENDYYLGQNPPNNIAVWGTLWRKYYYPNPFPNSFYSGNTDNEPFGMGQPENYYSWTWGNALFVVLDVYRDENDTSPKPKNWNWSLGLPQYTWLQNTLQNSTAQFKFVFAHHVRGQGRGGITEARLFEWGGYEQNGASYTFPTNRPGWAMPIHDLFRTYGVNVFFQGHDHLFAHEVMDSVTYQEVPMPSDSTYEIGMLANADAYTADTIGGTGHLRVHVEPNCVTVDFVRAWLPADTIGGLHQNGEVAFSYSVGACTNVIDENSSSDEVKIFPNPATERIVVQFKNQPSDLKISLINAVGQTLVESKNSLIDVSALPNGIYFLLIESDGSRINKKVVVQR